MPNIIYSTLPTDTAFAVYQGKPDGSTAPVRHVLVKGGGQIAVASGTGFHTPLGVATEVSDDDLDFLKHDWTFNHYLKNGFVRIENKKIDVEKAAADMNIDVPSAPLSESDIAEISTAEGVEVKVYEDNSGARKSR